MNDHNHHCIVTFNGINWRIVRASPGLLKVRSIDGIAEYETCIDISGVDFELYSAMAVEMDYAKERR